MTDATVPLAECSTNVDASWTSGDDVNSTTRIRNFLIRVVDNSGVVHNFKYDGSTVIEN